VSIDDLRHLSNDHSNWNGPVDVAIDRVCGIVSFYPNVSNGHDKGFSLVEI